MPPPPRPRSVASSSDTVRPNSSDPLCREVLYRVGVILDPTGFEVEEEEDINNLLDKYILKECDQRLPD